MIDLLEIDEQKVHAHVVASLANHKSPSDVHLLDACIMGRGQGEEAIEQAAAIWIAGVAAPLFSLLTGREQLVASHFTGTQVWGVPGRHGWIGMTITRGTCPLDAEEQGALPLFSYDDYPQDELLHLAKVTLLGIDGKWQRYLEIDGHAMTHVDEDWQCGIAAPKEAFTLISFAVFFSEG